MPEPTTLRANAWTGDASPASTLGTAAVSWALGRAAGMRVPELLKVPGEADPGDWRDPRVGWGLVLSEKPGLSAAQLATCADAPEAIQALAAARNQALILRYRSEAKAGNRLLFLRDYKGGRDLAVDRSMVGTLAGALPSYLLLYGSPEEIPWEMQYILSTRGPVGRLDLAGEALESYVAAAIGDWNGSAMQPDHAVVWAVDHPGDITNTMWKTIASPVHAALAADGDIGGNAVLLQGGPATAAGLLGALGTHRPSLIVTTSHGKTGPLADPAAMQRDLGLPVDQDFATLDPAALLAGWQPDGAIWYAHACCSAGSDRDSNFVRLFEQGDPLRQLLASVAALGSLTAPLPRALLGAKKPLRAFVGKVEPTFDWTLEQPSNHQHLTAPLVRALYNQLFAQKPVGLAFRDWHVGVGTLFTTWAQLLDDFNSGQDVARALLYTRLAAQDLQTTVILGDPAVALPPYGH
jgi:hypothetical protein